jgi:hypothetical protein
MSDLCKAKVASFDPGGRGVTFLVSEKSRFITGKTLEVNEGFLMDEYAVRRPAELGYFDLVIHEVSHQQSRSGLCLLAKLF